MTIFCCHIRRAAIVLLLYLGALTQVHAASLVAGNNHSCGIISIEGLVKCWGDNSQGQLGNGEAATTFSVSPVGVISGVNLPLSGAVDLTAGLNHTCALLNDSSVKCWGSNTQGQLGRDPAVLGMQSYIAVASGLTGVQRITAGDEHTCAQVPGVLPLGSVNIKCWGSNSFGQLGNGSFVSSASPVTVSDNSGNAMNFSGITLLAAGGQHTCAAHPGLSCWGDNSQGQLADEPIINPEFSTPAPIIMNGSNITPANVALGAKHSCALTSANGALCWGANGARQLGYDTGAQAFNFTPTPLPPLNSTVLSAGTSNTCAIVDDSGSGQPAKQAKCWGSNQFGQLGDGSQVVDSLSPVLVTGLQDIETLAVGGKHACALSGLPELNNVAVNCWGSNQFGQLGSGATGTGNLSRIPVPVNFGGGTQPPPTTVHFTSSPITVAVQDREYRYTVTARDPSGQPFTISAVSLPSWLALNATKLGTSTLVGTPGISLVGTTHAVELAVSNGTDSDTQKFNIQVLSADSAGQTGSGRLFGFELSGFIFPETAGTVAIRVQRGIDCPADVPALAVNYATADGNALDGTDYTAVSGTLTWGVGDCSPKTFDVTILDDAVFEGDEGVFLHLSGDIIADRPIALLGIRDGEDNLAALPPDQDPNSGLRIDSASGQLFDPNSGYQVATDSGNLIDASGSSVDPLTGLPVDPDMPFLVRDTQGLLVEPITGAIVSNGGFINPNTGAAVDFTKLDLGLLLAQQAEERLGAAALNKLETVINQLKPGWRIDPDTGAFFPPAGTNLGLPPRDPPALPPQLKLPELPNLAKGVAVSGSTAGGSALDEINDALSLIKFAVCSMTQNDDGLLTVSCGNTLKFSFMPGSGVQAGEGFVPGLGRDKGGNFTLTTRKGRLFTLIAGPRNFSDLATVFGSDSQISLDSNGVLSMRFFVDVPDTGTTVRARTERTQYVRTSSDSRDSDANSEPGLIQTDSSTGVLVYSDSTEQDVQATVPQPEVFIEKGLEISGVEAVTYTSEGTFLATYLGTTYVLTPQFDPVARAIETGKTVEPGITLSGDKVIYTVEDEGEEIVTDLLISVQ